MTSPLDIVASTPSLSVLLPFLWVLWQVYAPAYLNCETWWTNVKDEFRTEIDNVRAQTDDIAGDVSDIKDTQEKLINITVAQTHKLNGYDGPIDVHEVEDQLLDESERSPDDYLAEDRYRADDEEDT